MTMAAWHSSPPEAVNDKNPLVAASDGSFWLRCSVGNCVHVTRDHGTSWQTLSTVDSAAAVAWVVTSDGDTVYAAERSGERSRVVRSTNGGLTWSTVLDLPWLAWSDLARPNGDLILVRSSEEGGA
ncbi:MAG: WD40/YVTN/BNR-like repeat-containing protein [Micromonosporaceae bacterium]